MPSLEETIVERRSVRSYQDQEVPVALVRDLLDLARRAPSSLNGQPCHFFVLRDAARRRRLAEIKNRHCPPEKKEYPADFLALAPVVVVVCVERRRSFGRELENGILAAAFLLLAAHARGLAGVYLSAYPSGERPGERAGDRGLAAEIRALVALPEGLVPVAIVPLGYPAAVPPAKVLRSLEEIVHA
ncbi:MAG TPA: nitroreductase family protein [Candidatus Bathyarchaeia archaeon]|nr:nitroreductase family protein [Candidatus Bathyarchaeia archaeon]